MQEAPAMGDMRVALLWSHADAEGDVRISDDHPWPADSERMLFPITELPELASFFNWGDPLGELAIGGLLVYRDRDGDEAFTRTRLGEPFQDHVVGWSPGLRVVSAPAEPGPYSEFPPGITFYKTIYVDGRVPESTVASLGDIAIDIEVFDAPHAQCLGLTPLVSQISPQADTRPPGAPVADMPLGDTGLPIVAGIPECGFSQDQRPEGWTVHSARCSGDNRRLGLVRFVETQMEGIAALCGRQVSRCEIRLEPEEECGLLP